jgi:hypothetical protein
MNRFTFCLLVFVVVSSASAANAQRAGKGSYQPKILPPPVAAPSTVVDNQSFVGHYLRLEASTWFMNDQGNVLRDKTVSGTLDIHLGEETYQVVLGTYELSGGNQTAPVFNKAILDYRAYAVGDLRLVVFLKGIKKDRLLGALLKNIATSAIGIAGEKIGTLTTLGFSSVLTGAGQELFKGVQDTLKNGESPYPIFEEGGGLDFTIPRTELVGREKFYLAYKGDDISNKQVRVQNNGQGVYDVTIDNGVPLRQGAWILFRIVREDSYGNQRPWQPKAEAVRGDLDDLMQNWRLGAKTKQEVATTLNPTLRGETLADKVLAVRAEIRADGVLTPTEKTSQAGKLVALLEVAQDAAKVDNGFTRYFANRDQLVNSMREGVPSAPSIAREALLREALLVSEDTQATFRRNNLLNRFSEIRSQLGSEAFETLRWSTADTVKALPEFQKIPETRRKEIELALTSEPVAPPSETELWQRFAEIERAKQSRRPH